MLNLHAFPLVPFPGLPPEQAVRSGMGGWEPYAQPAPADRLPPFVLTRPRTAGSSRWVDCAWIAHADNPAQRIATLVPTGPSAAAPGPFGLVLTKQSELARPVDHFVYAGALIPGLALPCGVPLRLLVDGAWQGPRFAAYPDLADFLALEWWHSGPLGNVPYGHGLRQRLYVAGAALAYAPARTEREVSNDAATGRPRLDFLALYRGAALQTEPLPTYLLESLSAMEAHDHLTLDGEPWRAREVKDTPVGDAGGRSSLRLSLEQETVVVVRAAPAAPLALLAYDPAADAAHPWRCGDAGDVAPDWRTQTRTCAVNAAGDNTGLVNLLQRDVNPQSPGFNQTRTLANAEGPDLAACPLPVIYLSNRPSAAEASRNNCPAGQTGSSVLLVVPAGQFTSRVSVANANALADAYVAANAQANANAQGTCSTAGAEPNYQPLYEAGGCFTNQMRNAADFADVRAATAAEITLYHRDYANDGSTCPL